VFGECRPRVGLVPVGVDVPRNCGLTADNRCMRARYHARLIVVATATLLLPACSDYKDALVVNPCDEQIQVRFGGNEASEDALARRTAYPIRPMTTQFVDSVFADVGPDQYSVLVDVNGTSTLIHVADVGETVLVPVPDSLC
jgi:hypothetical protein